MSPLSRLRRRQAAFAQAKGGTAAIEFALVLAPFVFMLFAVFELALVFWVSTSVENAMFESARRIRTGEVQSAGMGKSGFKSDVCGRMVWLRNACMSNLSIDVRTFEQFNDVTSSDPVKDGEIDDASMQFMPGGPEDIVLVRAFMKWKLITPFLSEAMERVDGGYAVVESASTFRNEPFGE
jgi:Flp pilus assembly protein TadG